MQITIDGETLETPPNCFFRSFRASAEFLYGGLWYPIERLNRLVICACACICESYWRREAEERAAKGDPDTGIADNRAERFAALHRKKLKEAKT